MNNVPPRRASLVLVTRDGRVLGRLPEMAVATPWWQEVRPVLEAAREQFGLEAVILRLLKTELPRPQGGGVIYLAEVGEPLPAGVIAALEPWTGPLDGQPLRLRWAEPGGPHADLAWAEDVARARGLERTGAADQLRSWNLSSIWRLPLADGAAWLKVVPPFFAHEGDMLRRLQGGPVPRLLGHDGDRILLADVPGGDQYDAALPALLEMVSALVRLQAAWIGREDELLVTGLPDWRARALTAAIADVVARRGADLGPGRRATLDGFVTALPARFAAVEACRLPDTFAHGDFHPGNVRGTPGNFVILDWGDCGVGHPLLDLSQFLDRVPPAVADQVRDHWLTEWRRAVPASDPARAAELLAPVAAARQAVNYQLFVDSIEPVERRFHDADVTEWLERTAALLP